MSDLAIFIVGTGIFSVTTTATLLYGYLGFQAKAREEGIIVEPTRREADSDTDDPAPIESPYAVPVDIARVSPAPDSVQAAMASR